MKITHVLSEIRNVFSDKLIVTDTKITKDDDTKSVLKVEVIHTVIYNNSGKEDNSHGKTGNNVDVMI